MQGLRRDLLVAFFAIAVFLAAIPIFTYIYYASVLASQESILNHKDTGIILLDRKDRPFFTFYQAKVKEKVSLSDIPSKTQQAFIAMEDRRFYEHAGFSVQAIIRSLFNNIAGGSFSYGGSTITQQLVKNSLLTPKKDILRKIQEIILANEIERRYTKAQILEMYLNSVYFGENSFGVEEAAKTYFNKEAEDLSLAQSAALVAILPAPSRLSLFNGNFPEVKNRQRIVLEKMVEQGYITALEKDAAVKEDLRLAKNTGNINTVAPHFALMVKDQLINQYGEETVVRSGFKVKTSLDLDFQKYAEDAVAKHIDNLRKDGATNGSAVVLDPATSEIKALVGSVNWYEETFGKVNMALAERSPGSAFKPVVYLKAFEENFITTATILHDQPTKFANFDEDKIYASYSSRQAAITALSRDPQSFYNPQNFDRRFRGLVTARKALANSLNVPSVEIMKKVGVEKTLESARALGITTLKDPSNYGLSLVLGTGEVKLLELTNAYAVFANRGYRNNPTAILEITDKNGDLVFKHQSNPQPVVDPRHAFLITSILSDNRARSEVFGNALNISRPAAVKTGTAESFKDSLTVGYTPNLVIGIWVGDNFGKSMKGVAGSLGAAPIWKDLMEKFSTGTPVQSFEQPEGIVKIDARCTIDLSSKIASVSANSEFFIQGTEPPKNCPKPPTPSPVPQVSATPSPAPSSPALPAQPSIPQIIQREDGSFDIILNF